MRTAIMAITTNSSIGVNAATVETVQRISSLELEEIRKISDDGRLRQIRRGQRDFRHATHQRGPRT